MIDDDVLDEELREGFAAAVADARTGPDPYLRLLHRAKVRRRNRLGVAGAAVTAAAVATLVAVPGYRPSSAVPVGKPGAPIASEWTRRLIASPTRGSLSGDNGYLRAFAQAVSRHRKSLDVSPRLDRMAILFVGDVGATRVALVALYNGERALAVWYAASAGAPADRLASQATLVSDRIEPFERSGYQARPFREEQMLTYLIGVAPAGCVIDTAADPQHQAWHRAPGGSFVAGEALTTTDWWQVTCDGIVHYQGPGGTGSGSSGGGATVTAPEVSDAQLDAALVDSRGDVDRDTARSAVQFLLLSMFWAPPTGPPRVLWGGTEPGSTYPLAVAAVPRADGWSVTLSWATSRPGDADPPGGSFGFGTHVRLDDPAALLGIRMTDRLANPLDLVLVLGPRGATTVVVVAADGHEAGRAALTAGAGWVDAPTSATLRVLDAKGTVLATHLLDVPPDAKPVDRPLVDSW